MSLSGELEDLPFVDILQVVCLSHRTGQLRIDAGPGRCAALGFRDGKLVSAHTWESVPLASQTLPATAEERELLVRRNVVQALRLLLGVSTGRFEFQAEDADASGRRVRIEELSQGLDAQATILELLRQVDEAAAPAAPEAAAQAAARVDLGDGRMMAEFKRRLEAVLIADPASRYAVGIAYRGMGLLDDAVREFERAAGDPRYSFQAWSMLGLCHLERLDASEAVRWLEKARALDGRSEHERQSLRVLLALAYAAAGRLGEALGLYEQFARHGVWLADLAQLPLAVDAPRSESQVIPFPRAGTRR